MKFRNFGDSTSRRVEDKLKTIVCVAGRLSRRDLQLVKFRMNVLIDHIMTTAKNKNNRCQFVILNYCCYLL